MNLYLFILFYVLQSTVGTENDHAFEPRIFGGKDADDGQAPYIVSLRVKNNHYCAGVILSDEWILTAAHCLKAAIPSVMVVGTNNLSIGGQKLKVKNVRMHESYDRPKWSHDIGLIRVEGKIKFNDKVKPIKLVTGEVPDETPLLSFGWGVSAEGNPEKLQVLTLNAISDYVCGTILEGKHDSNICTSNKPSRSMCNGDSGGPLVWNGKLVGLVSFGRRPCGRGLTDVFAKISFFINWIKQNTGLSNIP